MFDFLRKKPVEKRDINIDVDENESFNPLTLSYLNFERLTSSMTLSAVFCGVEMISNSVAQLPIQIKDKDGNVIEHYLDSVFKNGMLTKFNLIKNIITDMILQGNGLCYISRKNGLPDSLIYLPKGTYTINYVQETRKLTYTVPSISSKPILPKDIIHIVKNTTDGIIGRGLLYYASRALGIANSADKQAENYFSSGAGVNGILKSSRHLSKKQTQEITQSWNSAHAGNSSGIAVLPVDLDWIQIGNNASEAQLLESRLFSVQEIARFLCISPVLLMDLSHSSYSTIEAAQIDFLQHTLQTYVSIIEHEFNRKLVPDGDVLIDLDELSILKADSQSSANYLAVLVQNGIITRNEARKQLGYQEIDGADEITVSYSDISQNTFGKSSETEEDK